MNNKKSLYWGLAGLALVILVGVYLYSQDQERRMAETHPENQISVATEQTDGTGEAGQPSEVKEVSRAESSEQAEAAGETSAEPAAKVEVPQADGGKPVTTTQTPEPAAEEPAQVAESRPAAEDTVKPAAQPPAAVSETGKTAESMSSASEGADTAAPVGEATAAVDEPATDGQTTAVAEQKVDGTGQPETAATEPVEAGEQPVPGTVAERATAPEPTETTLAPSASDNVEEPVETAALDTSAGTQPARDGTVVTQPADGQTVDAETKLPVPQFDLLRVEPDGSTVIAGRAQPGTTVEVVTGDAVLTKAPVGRTGDFAAVLDVPLAPGDYQITLREVRSGEVLAESEEIATVSVPDDDPAALLVMVTKPGEASRLLTQPEAATEEPALSAEARTSDVAESGQSSSSTDERVAAVSADQASGEAAPQPETASGQAASETAPAASETRSAALEPQAEQRDASVGTPVVSERAEPAADEPKNLRTLDLADARLRIDAVEIEGSKLFVAGSAAPVGANVRVYANGKRIGDSPVSASERFLVEADHALPVGQHTISADLMMHGSDASSMRVAVPFARPSGNQVAAVAAPDAVTERLAPVRQRAQSTDATDTTTHGSPDGDGATAETTVVDRAQEAGSATEVQPPRQEEAEVERKTVVVRKKPAAETIEPKPAADTDRMVKAEKTGDTEPVAVPERTASQEESRVASVQEKRPTPEVAPSAPQVVVQPALEPRDGSVIIRRGDTLWQISRRVYGRGVRYTTIYLANTDQIVNPDFIEPGQVFKVPEDPLDNAEDLHRQRIRSR